MKRIVYALLIICLSSLFMNTTFAQSDAGESRISTVQKELSVSLYPLPTNGSLYIAFNKSLPLAPEVIVYDMIGNLVENIPVERETAGTFAINLNGKRPGFYFIKIQSGETTFSRRITVTP